MSLKILLADDSMTAQNMGKKILTDAGYEVVAVSNGAAAVKKFAEHKPDLAILDIYMPGYTGLEVCERVKSTLESSRTPVLLTVGKMEPYRVEDGARVRADGVIVKPFEATDLLAAIEKLVHKVPTPPKPAWSDSNNDDPNNIETSSFQAVKDETAESTTPERFTLSQEMQVAPAMDFQSIGIEPVQHEMVSAAEMAIAAPPQFEEAEISAESAGMPWQPAGFIVEEAEVPADQNDEPMFASAAADEPEVELPPASEYVTEASASLEPELELPTAAEAVAEPSTGIESFEVEFNSAPAVGEIEVAAAPELEPDETAAAEVEVVTDPGLLAPEVAAVEFPASFGTEAEPEESSAQMSAEEAPAEMSSLQPESSDAADEFESRVAAAMAAYEGDASGSTETEAAPIPEWHAEPVDVDASDAAVSLEAELAQHFPGTKFNTAAEFGSTPTLDSFALPPTASLMVAETAVPEPVPEPEAFEPVEDIAPAEIMEQVAAEPAREEILPIEPVEEIPAPEEVAPIESEEEVAPEAPAPLAFSAVASAAAGAAAMSVPTEEFATSKPELDDERIANAIQRVLDRFKPQIVSEIARELTKPDED